MQAGISIPTTLHNGIVAVDFRANVDTGSSHCLFERRHGEFLELDVESGERRRFATAIGGFSAFGHVVTVETLDLRFESMVYFFEDPAINKNVLGRVGWLDRIRFGLIEHDQAVFLAEYDFESETQVQ
jgi:hypothetical protein